MAPSTALPASRACFAAAVKGGESRAVFAENRAITASFLSLCAKPLPCYRRERAPPRHHLLQRRGRIGGGDCSRRVLGRRQAPLLRSHLPLLFRLAGGAGGNPHAASEGFQRAGNRGHLETGHHRPDGAAGRGADGVGDRPLTLVSSPAEHAQRGGLKVASAFLEAEKPSTVRVLEDILLHKALIPGD